MLERGLWVKVIDHLNGQLGRGLAKPGLTSPSAHQKSKTHRKKQQAPALPHWRCQVPLQVITKAKAAPGQEVHRGKIAAVWALALSAKWLDCGSGLGKRRNHRGASIHLLGDQI